MTPVDGSPLGTRAHGILQARVLASENEAVNEARATYKSLYDKHRAECAPEAERVREAGGLFILGTERHESRRIDNQLRGRSGRQGDPGESRFYLSLEDDLMRLFGSDRIAGLCARLGIDENTAIDAKILSGSIEGAQKRIEDSNFQRRKNVITYDDVMNQQRNVIYQQRSEVLLNDNIQEKIEGMIRSSVEETFDFCFGVETPEDWKFDEFRNHYRGILTDEKNFKYTPEELLEIDKDAWRESLVLRAMEIYREKDALFANVPGLPENAMREVEKVILLQNVDKKWMDHLEAMDELKEYVGLNSYAQRDPVAMYRIQGADMFDEMVDEIKEDTVRQILAVLPKVNAAQRVQVANPTSAGFADGGDTVRRPAVSKKVGRNDPCPCGSGKKYKKCCGIGASENQG